MKKYIFFIAIFIWIIGCSDDDNTMGDGMLPEDDLIAIDYDPQSYQLNLHDSMPVMQIPADNPLTVQAVELGRHLFYDPVLSVDSTISCASCHPLSGGLTDNLPFSFGVNDAAGTRGAMTLFNIGFADNGLFWDGRDMTLEIQALEPIINPVEMNNTWEDVEMKLRRSGFYPQMFREAFGIERRDEITRELVTKALASFERTLILFGGSKFDRVWYLKEPGLGFTEKELDGFFMFVDQLTDQSGGPVAALEAECEHCHGRPLFSTDVYRNNGLTNAETLEDFPDYGRGLVTNNPIDNGKFRSPTLRNIALTAPYMHDGQFQTLEEVVEHYNSGGHPSLNKSLLVAPKGMTEYQKEAMVAFLHTLTDTTYLSNPAFQNPFEE